MLRPSHAGRSPPRGQRQPSAPLLDPVRPQRKPALPCGCACGPSAGAGGTVVSGLRSLPSGIASHVLGAGRPSNRALSQIVAAGYYTANAGVWGRTGYSSYFTGTPASQYFRASVRLSPATMTPSPPMFGPPSGVPSISPPSACPK